MKTLFENARILTMADGDKFIDGYLVAEDSKITYVGTSKPKGFFFKKVNCKGMVLMPGLKNAHTHSAMTFLRGVGEGLPLMEWLAIVNPIENRLTEDDVYWLTQTAFIEYVRSGTTACFDMYFHADAISKAAEDFGFKTANIYFLGGNGERMEKARNAFHRYGKDSYVKPIVGYHAEYTTGDGEYNAVNQLKEEFKQPVWTHVSETEGEVRGCYDRRGVSPVQFMLDRGFFKYGGGGYHCIWFSEDDMRICKENNVHIVSCPGSNLKLKDGLAPLTKYWKYGLNVSLGTDGASSNESLSMWREMHLAAESNPEIPAFEIVKMATTNGARAIGFDDCDTLEVGKKADLIIVDAKSIDDLAHLTRDEDVKGVYINGKRVKYNEKKIMKKAAEIRYRLVDNA